MTKQEQAVLEELNKKIDAYAAALCVEARRRGLGCDSHEEGTPTHVYTVVTLGPRDGPSAPLEILIGTAVEETRRGAYVGFMFVVKQLAGDALWEYWASMVPPDASLRGLPSTFWLSDRNAIMEEWDGFLPPADQVQQIIDHMRAAQKGALVSRTKRRLLR